jgi:hypothetical protein
MKTRKLENDEPSTPRNLDGEGQGNQVNYEGENIIKVNYQDVDGDGEMDNLVVFEDNAPEYKTQGSVMIKQDKNAK